MAAQPADSSPSTSEFENVSPGASANAGESDWTEADDTSAAGGMSRGASLSGTLQTGVPVQSGSFSSLPGATPSLLARPGVEAQGHATGRDAKRLQGRGGSSRPGSAAEAEKPYSTLKEIEDASHKVADFTKTAAVDLSKKLFGGGGGGGRDGGGEEAFSISRLTEGVSSWWSALDASTLSPEAPSRPPTASQVQSDAQLFGLPATEAVLEAFERCTLVQTYTCTHNNYTPDREVGWEGRLVVTEQHTCWKSNDATEDAVTLMLPHSDVTAAEKIARGGRDALRVTLADGEHLSLRFGGGADLDGALALLEHLTTPPGPP